MVVPIGDPATQWTVESCRNDLDTGFDETPRHQALLPPLIAAVPIADLWCFQIQVEGFGGRRTRQQIQSLRLELIHRPHDTGLIDFAAEVVKRTPQLNPFA